MARNKKLLIKEYHKALDECRWMLEEARYRGNKSEIDSIHRDMNRIKNNIFALKGKDKKGGTRHEKLMCSDEIALALCSF